MGHDETEVVFRDDDEPMPPEPPDTERAEAEHAMDELRAMGVDLLTDEKEAQESGGFTIVELERITSLLRKIDKLGPDNPFTRRQWARSRGNYTLVGDTVDALPPGFYDISVDQAGSIFFVPYRARTEELLRFPDAATDKIVSEIETFWEREHVFAKFGLPFKRGILLYGPPGGGKTCTLQLLARDVVARGGIVIIYQPELFVMAYRQFETFSRTRRLSC